MQFCGKIDRAYANTGEKKKTKMWDINLKLWDLTFFLAILPKRQTNNLFLCSLYLTIKKNHCYLFVTVHNLQSHLYIHISKVFCLCLMISLISCICYLPCLMRVQSTIVARVVAQVEKLQSCGLLCFWATFIKYRSRPKCM